MNTMTAREAWERWVKENTRFSTANSNGGLEGYSPWDLFAAGWQAALARDNCEWPRGKMNEFQDQQKRGVV